MDFTAALPTFIITLREGVEAALVVGIVLACLQKAKQKYLNKWVYLGIGLGIAASGMVGVILGEIIKVLSSSNNPYAPALEMFLEASFGIIAIAMLSWMLIWMTRQAKFLKSQVEGAVNIALEKPEKTAGWGIFSLVFIAILREGFETVIFIVGKFQQGLIPSLGSLVGLSVAAAIGVLLFKWGVRINIRLFFQVMGIFLLMIVAGLVVSSLDNLDQGINLLASANRQSANLCFFYERFVKEHSCILGSMIWNSHKSLPDDQFPGLILKTLFGYHDRLYLVQAIAYIGFLGAIGSLYFHSLKPQKSINSQQLSRQFNR